VRPHRQRRAAGGRPARLFRSEAGGGDRRAHRAQPTLASAAGRVDEELFGCPITVGTVDAILTRTAETLEPVYDELLKQTRSAGALNIDETGWYLSGEPRTLWGAFSKRRRCCESRPTAASSTCTV